MTATTYLPRLQRLAEVKSRQARQVRNADNTARGERIAGEADLDAAAIRWALEQIDPGSGNQPVAAAAE